MVPTRALFRVHFGRISEALDSALGPWGTLGEALEVFETGLGNDGFSLIIQGGSRIPHSLKVEGGIVWFGVPKQLTSYLQQQTRDHQTAIHLEALSR